MAQRYQHKRTEASTIQQESHHTNIASLRAFASGRGRRVLSLRQSVRSHLRPGAVLQCRKFTCLIRNTSTSAPWRRDRLDHWSCTDRLRDQGRSVSPLFLAPGVSLATFKLDWLHIADLGVGADWLGQLFSFLLPKMRGGNRAARVADFWKRIQGLYTTHPCSSRRQPHGDHASEVTCACSGTQGARGQGQGLIPIAGALARDLLGDDDPVEVAAKSATAELEGCYQCLSWGSDSSRLAEHCVRFCTLCVSLEEQADYVFRVKPKTHLFQELCEMSGPTRPAAHWTYRDEDFGGSTVALGR